MNAVSQRRGELSATTVAVLERVAEMLRAGYSGPITLQCNDGNVCNVDVGGMPAREFARNEYKSRA